MAGAFLAGAFFAVVLAAALVTDFLAVVFLAIVDFAFVAVVFLAVVFAAVAFFAGAFLVAAFFAGAFLTAGLAFSASTSASPSFIPSLKDFTPLPSSPIVRLNLPAPKTTNTITRIITNSVAPKPILNVPLFMFVKNIFHPNMVGNQVTCHAINFIKCFCICFNPFESW